MLGEFFSWWSRHLRELVPSRLRSGAEEGPRLLADASDPALLTLVAQRRGSQNGLGQFRTDAASPALRSALAARPAGEPVMLRIPAALVLERDVTLPLAAERELDRVLGYEMERLTPFSAEEVFWAAATRARDRNASRLDLRLALVPRAAVQPLIDLLQQAGRRPDALEAETRGGLRRIALSHDGRARTAGLLSSRAATAAAAALLLLVLVSPFLHQSLALAEVGSRLSGQAAGIAEVESLRRRITGAGSGGDAIASETRRLGDTLEALAAITEILPDDSYLNEFTMRERHMTLSGLSASAPRLISGLSADPRIRNPAFTAPVTRQEGGRPLGGGQESVARDVFSIRAELAP